MTRYRLFESVTNETLDTVELTEHGDIIGGDSGGFDIVAALISTVGVAQARLSLTDWSNGYVSSQAI